MFASLKILKQNNFRINKTFNISFRFLILLLIYIPISIQVHAQKSNLSLQHFGIEQGMSSESVASIYQDRNGFLWFYTEKGLDKYDGYTFSSYKYPLNSKLIGELLPGIIAEDKQGYIWVASLNGGLEKFDPEKLTFKNYILDPSKPKTDYANSAYEVYIDRNDIMWVGTGNGFYKFNKANETFGAFRYDSNNKSEWPNYWVNTIFEDKSGILWLGTRRGIVAFDLKIVDVKQEKIHLHFLGKLYSSNYAIPHLLIILSSP